MKKLYKRVLAAMLSLALVAAVIPATAFACAGVPRDDEEHSYWLQLGYIPGQLIVTLYEQYYTIDDEVNVNLADILQEIEIESYTDLYLCVLTDVQRQTFSKERPDYSADIGTTFLVNLADKTPEATETAIDALARNPYVKWVEKNVYLSAEDAFDVMPDDPIEPEYEITVGDALKALRVAAGLQEATAELVAAYDTDGDGEITVADALTVLRIAAKLA